MDIVFAWITLYGYWALFFLLMLGIVGLPVPDETLLLFAGYLAFKGNLHFAPLAIAAILGSMCGISLSYILGRWLGPLVINKYHEAFHLSLTALDRTKTWYQRKGKYALFFGYYLPGIRHVTALVAGSAQLPLSTFALFAYSGGMVWSVSFLTLGYGLGEEWNRLSGVIHQWLILGTVCVLATIGLGIVIKKRRLGK